jgi:hypothetical protein
LEDFLENLRASLLAAIFKSTLGEQATHICAFEARVVLTIIHLPAKQTNQSLPSKVSVV